VDYFLHTLDYDLKAKYNSSMQIPGSQKYFREYLCENENIFENILGYCSRAQVLSIYAKNQSSKISCCSPFKSHDIYKWIDR